MSKIGKNWGKIANYPPHPMLNKDLHHCLQLPQIWLYDVTVATAPDSAFLQYLVYEILFQE